MRFPPKFLFSHFYQKVFTMSKILHSTRRSAGPGPPPQISAIYQFSNLAIWVPSQGRVLWYLCKIKHLSKVEHFCKKQRQIAKLQKKRFCNLANVFVSQWKTNNLGCTISHQISGQSLLPNVKNDQTFAQHPESGWARTSAPNFCNLTI